MVRLRKEMETQQSAASATSHKEKRRGQQVASPDVFVDRTFNLLPGCGRRICELQAIDVASQQH